MENLILIFLCLFLGFLFKKINRFPENFSSSLNFFIIYVSLPGLILFYIPELNFTDISLVPVLFPWLIFIFSYIFYTLVSKFWDIPQKTFVCLVLCSGLGNTSFLGLPMVEYYYGKSAIPYAILSDQLGTFLVLSILGFPFLLTRTGESFSKKEIVSRVISFPPFLALLIAFFLVPFSIPNEFKTIFKRLGESLVPLAMISVGYSWKWKAIHQKWKYLVLGLGFKLVLAPMICALLIFLFLPEPLLLHKVAIFEVAMPPMITAGILAMDKDQDPLLAGGLVGVGLLVSFFTLFLWWTVL